MLLSLWIRLALDETADVIASMFMVMDHKEPIARTRKKPRPYVIPMQPRKIGFLKIAVADPGQLPLWS